MALNTNMSVSEIMCIAFKTIHFVISDVRQS
jgi:hypothetical protein